MIKRVIIGILLNALALYLVTEFIDGITYTGGVKFFLIAGFIIGFLNFFVKPLMKLLTFPIVFMTLGLFSFVINVIIFWLTVKLTNGIHFADVTVSVNGVLAYIVSAIVFGLVNWVLHIFISNNK